MGCEVIGEGFTTVETLGTFDDTIRLNIHLRTANHVYFLVEKLMASSVDELYAGIKKLAWEEILFEDGYLSVNSVTDHPEIQYTMFLHLRVKYAVADRSQEMQNTRRYWGSEKHSTEICL